MNNKLVTFDKLGRHGRFANQLYQIAGTIGIARKNGYSFAFPEWKNWNGMDFEPDLFIDVQEAFENPLPNSDGVSLPELGIPWGYHDVKLTRSCSLLGHFQSVKYFEHCLEEVRWFLTMKDEPEQMDYCAVHWRAGDYGEQPTPQHPDGNPYHPRMALTYYEPALAQFPSSQRFLVFSDNIDGARQMLGNNADYAEGNDYLQDFKLMKRCKSYIIANSSYSAMAAVLSDHPEKVVVAPYPWFGGPYTDTLDPKDIYDNEWRIIKWK